MTTMFNATHNYTENCAYQCGSSSCANMAIDVHAALFAVCTFVFALISVIICGAIIGVIISVAIISIIDIIRIMNYNRICAQEVFLS